MAGAVLGDTGSAASPADREAFLSVVSHSQTQRVPCEPAMLERDRTVFQLAMVGYNAGDIARMMTAGTSRARLDEEYLARMAGFDPSVLPPDRERDSLAVASSNPGLVPTARPWRSPATGRGRVMPAAARTTARRIGLLAPAALLPLVDEGILPASVDEHIRRLAAEHQIDHRLVHAIIRYESHGDPDAVSRKGAIGLMQLMPATASMLNVNPRDPLDNLKGGIVYLADLLRTYGNPRDALIAYNAGPVHANQVLKGERTLFEETRRYLEAISSIYPLQ